ncbi:hypothetical protein [Aquisalimonas asiatica]|uniref:AbiTii domain-containing protein n=1 Tax=Aquisalimonas asiatica TaxID=406100 RepID=A0A1H8V0T9_9GAMM|nr:hypothetical protein [Aquisalimonas asiatica]SEP09102.1 hypothetical protein SAMN04488052_10947 [Aquisalimonas asiatica]
MASVLETLRDRAVDNAANPGDVLADALFYATVLRQKPVCNWLKRERDGYPDTETVPDYRKGNDATLVAWRPGVGWIEAPITDGQRQASAIFTLREELPTIVRQEAQIRKAGGKRLDMPPHEEYRLQSQTSLSTRLSLVVPASAYVRVLTAVRGAIALWAEALLEAGVRGHGSSFSREDRAASEAVTAELEALLTRADNQAGHLLEQAQPRSLLSRLFAGA